jgi:hypothetical protein
MHFFNVSNKISQISHLLINYDPSVQLQWDVPHPAGDRLQEDVLHPAGAQLQGDVLHPQQPLNRVQQNQARQSIIPDIRADLPHPALGTKRTYIKVKTVSGAKWYQSVRERKRGVERTEEGGSNRGGVQRGQRQGCRLQMSSSLE